VTTKQDVAETEEPAKEAEEAAAAGPVDYDLTGTWMRTEVTKGCGTKKTEKATIEITQKGNSITFRDKEKDWTWSSKASGNLIPISGAKLGDVTTEDYNLKVGGDANTLTGELDWGWKGECWGTTKQTYKRQ
jgi:hypothetical protein